MSAAAGSQPRHRSGGTCGWVASHLTDVTAPEVPQFPDDTHD